MCDRPMTSLYKNGGSAIEAEIERTMNIIRKKMVAIPDLNKPNSHFIITATFKPS